MGTELVVPIACMITVPIFPAKKKQIFDLSRVILRL